MADRFYCPDLNGPGEVHLVGAEAHHLATVRRFDPGKQVVLFNGDGNEYPAEIVSISKRAVLLNVLRTESPNRELGSPLVIAAALPKGDRADYLVEKLTELGVSGFVPLITSRSVVQPRDSVIDKFHRAVIEASKQSGRNRLMAVERPQRWEAFLARGDLPATRLVLHTGAVTSVPDSVGAIVVAIGPEGGFTAEEVQAAQAAGWQAVSLGPRTLRIETAAVAAAAMLAAPRTVPTAHINNLAVPTAPGLP